MFWRYDRTYICEKLANYSKCPQTSPYETRARPATKGRGRGPETFGGSSSKAIVRVEGIYPVTTGSSLYMFPGDQY